MSLPREWIVVWEVQRRMDGKEGCECDERWWMELQMCVPFGEVSICGDGVVHGLTFDDCM